MHWTIYVMIVLVMLLAIMANYLRPILALLGLHRHYMIPDFNLKGPRTTGVTDAQINSFGIAVTPKHPEEELRMAGAMFACQRAWRDAFATHTSIDGNLITGQNQNSGYETAHRILEKMATQNNS